MKTLADLCKPRASVFDKARLDTVYNLDDLPTIQPDEFLSENYVTEGMRILLTEAFNRLEGKTTSASGTFLLSQSMGGGKTHNLITLGLLAKYPKYRKQVMADFFKPGDGCSDGRGLQRPEDQHPLRDLGRDRRAAQPENRLHRILQPSETARSQPVGGTPPGGTGAHSPG